MGPGTILCSFIRQRPIIGLAAFGQVCRERAMFVLVNLFGVVELARHVRAPIVVVVFTGAQVFARGALRGAWVKVHFGLGLAGYLEWRRVVSFVSSYAGAP